MRYSTEVVLVMALIAVTACDSPAGPEPDPTGDLAVRVRTDGEDPDADGYTVSVASAVHSVQANDSTRFDALPVGAVSVLLQGLAENCSASGDNPRPVDILPGAEATVLFEISCSALVGALDIEVSTDGADLDPDGYRIVLDGDELAASPVSVEGRVSIGPVRVGTHEILLGGVAENCVVEAPNPRSVSVTYAHTTTLLFGVACHPTRGAIRAIVETAGHDVDPNGYLVRVDGGTAVRLGPDDEYLFSDLSEGPHEVTLSDLASHCSLSGTATRTVNVTPGSTAGVSFQISCAWRGPRLLAPAENATIQQNDPSAPCSDNPTRGRGFVITFDWSDSSHPRGVAHYDIELERAGASRPALSTATADSRHVWVQCSSFILDSNLTDWTWRVRAVSTDGETSGWSVRSLRFAPCRLASGAPCSAPAPAPARGTSLRDEGVERHR